MPFKEVKRQLETTGDINSISPIRGIRVPTDNSRNETQDKSLNTIDSISEIRNEYKPEVSIGEIDDQGNWVPKE